VFYRDIPLDGSLAEFHVAIDLLEEDTVPESYYNKVVASKGKRKRHHARTQFNVTATASR